MSLKVGDRVNVLRSSGYQVSSYWGYVEEINNDGCLTIRAFGQSKKVSSSLCKLILNKQ